MTATEKLLPCPFCGYDAHMIATSSIRAPWSNVSLNALGVAIVCDVCGATQPSQMYEEKAVEYWNRRAEDEQLHPEQAIDATLGRGECNRVLDFDGTRYVCSECGESMSVHRWKFCPNCGRKVTE